MVVQEQGCQNRALRAVYSDLQTADSFRSRAAALSALLDHVSDADNQQQLTQSTFDSMIPLEGQKCNSLTWIDIVKAAVRSISMKSASTFSMLKLTMWADLKKLLSISESYGKFLCAPGFLNVLLSCLVKSFNEALQNANQARLLIPIVDIIKLALEPAEYHADIAEKHYAELFSIFGRILMSLCSRELVVDDPLTACESQFGRSNPKSCVQIISKILCGYPYDIFPFLEDDVFPLFIRFFKLKPKDCVSSSEVVSSLVNVLRLHVLSATAPFAMFFRVVLPYVAEMMSSTPSASLLSALADLMATSLASMRVIGELDSLVAAQRSSLQAAQAASLDAVARLDVLQNSVYHSCGLSLVLCLSQSWLALIRLAAALLHILPLMGFDPDTTESIENSPADVEQAVKRRKVSSSCAWTNIFSSSSIPLPSLWLLYIYLHDHETDRMSRAFLERILSLLERDFQQFLGGTLSCELTGLWIIVCIRSGCDRLQSVSGEPWAGSVPLLSLVFGAQEVHTTSRNTSLGAQMSLLVGVLAEGQVTPQIECGVVSKTRNTPPSLLDPYSALLLAYITQGTDHAALHSRAVRIQIILRSLLDYNEAMFSIDFDAYQLVADHNRFQSVAVLKAIYFMTGSGNILDSTINLNELMSMPCTAPTIDQNCGDLDWYREQFPLTAHFCWIPSKMGSETIDLSYSLGKVITENITALLSQLNSYNVLQSVRLLHICVVLVQAQTADVLSNICSKHFEEIDDVSSQHIAAMIHLRELTSMIPPTTFAVLFPSLMRLVASLTAGIEESCSQPRSIFFLDTDSLDKKQAALTAVCALLKYIKPQIDLHEYGLRLLRCQAFRAAFTLLHTNSESALLFAESVHRSALSCVKGNTLAVNLSLAMLPQILQSKSPQIAIDLYNSFFPRIGTADAPESIESELPRSSRVVFYRVGQSFADYYRNLPATKFDPEEVLEQGCADLCFSVRRMCGTYAVNVIQKSSSLLRSCKRFNLSLADSLFEALADRNGLDHGRIISVLNMSSYLAERVQGALPFCLYLHCQAASLSNPTCSRNIAFQHLLNICSRLGRRLDQVLQANFEYIFAAYLQRSTALDFTSVNCFPIQLFLSDSPNNIFDFANLSSFFINRIIGGVFCVDSVRKTGIFDEMLSQSEGLIAREETVSFLYSRILLLSNPKKVICFPKSLSGNDHPLASVDIVNLLADIIEGVIFQEPSCSSESKFSDTLELLATLKGSKSVVTLLIGQDKGGRPLHHLIVQFRHLFIETSSWQMFKFTKLIKSFCMLGSTNYFRESLLISQALARQFLSCCLWLSIEFGQSDAVIPTMTSVAEFLYSNNPSLVQPMASDLHSGYCLCKSDPPSWLESIISCKESLQKEIEIFLKVSPSHCLLRNDLANQMRLRRLLNCVRDDPIRSGHVLDGMWTKLLHSIATMSNSRYQDERNLARRALGRFSLTLGHRKFKRLFYTDRIYSDSSSMTISERNKWILSHLCTLLHHSNPIVISCAVAALETIVGGETLDTIGSDHYELLRPFTAKVKLAPDLSASAVSLEHLGSEHSYDKWITSSGTSLSAHSKDDVLRGCQDLIRIDPETASILFPYLVLDYLLSTSTGFASSSRHSRVSKQQKDIAISLLSGLINNIAAMSLDGANGKTLDAALSAIYLIRQNKIAIDRLLWLDQLKSTGGSSRGSKKLHEIHPIAIFEEQLHLLLLAEACVKHAKHASAHFFLSLWCERTTSDCPMGLPTLLSQTECCLDESVTSKPSETIFRELLIKSASQSMDPDLLYGVCSGYFSEWSEQLLSRHQGHWNRLLQKCDNTITSSFTQQPEQLFGVQEALQNLHCVALLKSFSGSSSPFSYEAAWNCGDWSLEFAPLSHHNFNEYIYCALQSLTSDRTPFPVESVLISANESVDTHLLSFDEHVVLAVGVVDQLSAIALIEHESHREKVHSYSEDQTEFVRSIVNACLLIRSPTQYSTKCLEECQRAIDLDNEPLASFQLARCRQTNQISSDLLNIQSARLLWFQGQHTRAILSMGRLTDALADSKPDLAAEGNLCMARWAASARSHDYDYIYGRFAKAIKSTGVASPVAHFYFASFQDRTLHRLLEKENSVEDQRFAAQHLACATELKSLREQLKRIEHQSDDTSRRLKGFVKSLQLQYDEDKTLLERCRQKICLLAQEAVKNYLICIQLCDEYDLKALFRIISIWFNLYQRIPAMSRLIVNWLIKVDSSKFLPLLAQISSRLQTVDRSFPPDSEPPQYLDASKLFHVCVYQLVLHVLTEHPHLHLFTLLALRNLGRVPVQDHRLRDAYDMNTDKQKAASDLLHLLAQRSPNLAQYISSQLQMSEAYIELCSKKWSMKQSRIDMRTTSLGKLSRSDILRYVCAPTRGLPVQFRNDYAGALESAYSIVSFDRYATFTPSGLSRPIVLTYTCADGTRHQELIKPNDDLRQDAVMEQVFTFVNSLLKQDSKARQNGLKMRTYNVIPLTPCVGLVQFIQNAISIGDYLTPAHSRYRPNDWSMDFCRTRIRDAPVGNALKVYTSVTENCHPVFHHFLHEHFSHSPAAWLRAQLRYTRSVAVSSIVGYIVGLGDRHCQNILIDVHDFTLVHIDLGIAFDQGKLLKKPENVPFRLTRDIVDAMGVVGVEGVFRRTAELVLSILRENQDSILTLIGVFKFDPLYRWTISSKKVKRMDHASSESQDDIASQTEADSANINAVRACHGVSQKLEGREDGDLLSVQGQVRKLIVEAMSPGQLATMFHGWSAWL